MPPDIELSGVITEHDAIAQEPVRLNAAPQSALGSDLNGIWRHFQPVEAKPVEMGQPGRPIGEARLGLGRQTGNQRGGQRMLAHVAISGVIEHVIGMTGAE